MKVKIILLIATVALIASGCSISFNSGAGSGNDGGVYRSDTRGDSWVQKVLMPTTSGRPKSIGALNAVSLVMDPSDNKAIYLGTLDNGLFYSYDKGEDWQVSTSLGRVTVNDVAVDPSAKCTIYAASANKVFKSVDCARTWSQVYYDNDAKVSVNAIAIDHYNSNNVFIGTSRGEIIKSSDKGNSWQTLDRFEDNVEKIVIRPDDTRIMFVATARKGIFRSTDAGVHWTDLGDNLKGFSDAMRFRDLVVSSSEPGTVILATHYGLLESSDNGNVWKSIKLITPEKDAIINAVAIGPKDAKEIYYVTNSTFYRSIDGGANWSTKQLPTTRAGWKLLIDPQNPKTIYMGAKALK